MKNFKFPLINIAIQENQKPIDFIDNKFIPAEELFPNWASAESILEEFVNLTDELYVSPGTTVCIGLEFPVVIGIRGIVVSMYETFPLEYREIVKNILYKLIDDYIPNLDSMLYEKVNDYNKYIIKNKIRQREQYIISCGGRDIMEELKFRLGISCHFSLKICI